MTEVDELRKVIGKKQKEKIPFYQEKFVEGAAARRESTGGLAERLFHHIEPFAGYGFQQGARSGIRLDRVSDSLSQGESSIAIPRRADDLGQR